MKVLGKDWVLYDIKSIAQKIYNKVPGIKNFKRIELHKMYDNTKLTIKYKGSEFYRFETTATPFHGMLKRGKKENSFKLEQTPLGNQITEEKKRNIQELLDKQFSSENQKWEELPELGYYRDIICGSNEEEDEEETPNNEEEMPKDEEEICDCQEPDCTLHL